MAISIAYEVGEEVFVAYPFPSENFFNAQSRIVKEVRVLASGDDALVKFEDGNDVQDSDSAPTVFTSVELASTAIVDDIIVRSNAVANIDPTTSLGSTVSQPTLNLGRVDA